MWQKTYRVRLLNMTLPGKMKLSTGVTVLYADEESFTLMTPQGHMFSGWITFSADERDGETVARAQVLMRASDPIFELGLTWAGTSRRTSSGTTRCAVAAHFGIAADVDTHGVRGQEASMIEVEQRLAIVGHQVSRLHARYSGARGAGKDAPQEQPWLTWPVDGR